MKITIDDKNKTVEIEGEVSVSELLDFLSNHNLAATDYKIVGTKSVYQYYPYYPTGIIYPDTISNPYTWTTMM